MHGSSGIYHAHEGAAAHIVLKCKAGEERGVMDHLRDVEGVREIQRTMGEYDILVKMESGDSETLRRLIRWKVMKNEKILSAVTLMCMRKSLCAMIE